MPKGKDPELAAGASGGAGQSPGLTVVYLARHGHTPLNESGVLRSLTDPPLNVGLTVAGQPAPCSGCLLARPARTHPVPRADRCPAREVAADA